MLLLLLGAAFPGALSRAEDSERLRGYFRFSSGDVEPLWGVDDHWSLGLGLNFNRYLGAELAFDYYLRDWGKPQPIGEASSFHFVPEVRLRYPLFGDRLVPYLIAGVGPSWIQGKDVKSSAFNKSVSLEGYTYSVALGGGIEYFIADNLTFDLEGKYLWANPIDATVDGRSQSVDVSAPLFTFGLRIYFDENKPRPLASADPEPISRFYFGVRAGADFLTDGRWVQGVNLNPEQAAWGKVASQTGGLLFGVDLGRNFGVEIAGDHLNHVIDVDGLGRLAEYGQGWVLANFRLRFPSGRWVPYAYAGGGIAYGEFKDYQPASIGLTLEGDTMHPALNIGGGVEYFITRNLSVNTGVRWAYTWDQGFGIKGHVPKSSGDYSYFAATIGFRVYLFDL
jgi:opacity protein-like surface antigen